MRPWAIVEWSWLVWCLSWLVAAGWQEKVVSRPAMRDAVAYRLLTLAGPLVMFGFFDRFLRDENLWRVSLSVAWILAAIVLAGFAFTWWARLHLGALWSGRITRKADHRVVDTGPYRLVRHPIYTGLCLSAIATSAMRGSTNGCIGAALVIVGLYVKARQEERFLRDELGQAYDEYATRTGMLVPQLPTRQSSR